MAFDVHDLTQSIVSSRAWFFKHLRGLNDEQWIWKPYPECKSIRETLQHMITNDRAAIEALKTGHEPNYDELRVQETDISKLMQMLERSHHDLVDCIRDNFDGKPLDTEATIWGFKMKLGRGIPYFSSEDFFHAGQVAYIRMATDPSWDYYEEIYGSD